MVANPLGFQRLGRLVIDSSKFRADASAESVVKAQMYEALRNQLQAILKEANEQDQKEDQPSPGTPLLDKEVKPEQMREILRRVRKELAASKKKASATPTDAPGERRPLRPGMIPRIEAALKTIGAAEQEGLKHACLTDPDARMMGEGRDKPIQECHSFEVVVDKDAPLLVVGQTTGEGFDNSRLEPLNARNLKVVQLVVARPEGGLIRTRRRFLHWPGSDPLPLCASHAGGRLGYTNRQIR